MAYDEYTKERIEQVLTENSTSFTTKKMMGGIVFMVDDKMLCAAVNDKQNRTPLLMIRIGIENADIAIKESPLITKTGPMKGFIYITPDGYDLDEDLQYWIKMCLDFNPLAKRSKKK